MNPFRFTGRDWDSVSGHYYYRARHLDPQLGAFLSRDPIVNSGDLSQALALIKSNGSLTSAARASLETLLDDPEVLTLYQYVVNNPMNLSDPYGYACCSNPCKGPQPWKDACDPGESNPPQPLPPPPSGQTPGKGDACYYPLRPVSVSCGPFGGGWQSQCVCQCMGDSPGINCVRGCIQCAHNNGAPIDVCVEKWCQSRCSDWSDNDWNILNCCTKNNFNLGGCNDGTMDPNYYNKCCQQGKSVW